MDRPSRILIVEDDDAIRELLVEVLAQEGYEVAAEPNGERALERLALGEPPDAIVLDLLMPVMDGVQFLERLRREPRFAGVRVLVASATAKDPRLRALGVAAVLQKPVELKELLRLLALPA